MEVAEIAAYVKGLDFAREGLGAVVDCIDIVEGLEEGSGHLFLMKGGIC